MNEYEIIVTADVCRKIKKDSQKAWLRGGAYDYAYEVIKSKKDTDEDIVRIQLDALHIASTSEMHEFDITLYPEDHNTTNEEDNREKEIRKALIKAGYDVLHNDATGGFTVMF